MWSKLNSALRLRSGTPGLIGEEDHLNTGSGDVLASVFEQHPNLSVFHHPSEVPFPSPSPPASPSKHGHRGMFKRMSRSVAPNNESTEALPRMSLSKKVKPSLHGLTTDSLSRASAETFIRQSQDTARPSIDSTASRPSILPATPITENKQGMFTEGRLGSLRSILKPGNTPGTGQSVRFFSRDAYRVISPELSSSELEDGNLFNRLQRAAPSRPSAQQLFATPPPPPPKDGALPLPYELAPSTSTPTMGQQLIPPPNLGNIFEFSQEMLVEVPSIPPIDTRSPLLDTAVEVVETETERETETEKEDLAQLQTKSEDDSLPIPETLGPAFGDMLSESKPPPGLHDRSQSFSFGQTIFQSLKTDEALSKSSPARPPSANRSRALSDTVFTTMIHSPATALADSRHPEADINDMSKAIVAYRSPPKKVVEHDPFAANAVTYYEPGKMLPPSPPQSTHTRTASREEDIIWSLRTQLALQSELCGQYEVDLNARDRLVEALNARLTETERECERRKNIVRSWRKRVSELEKCVKQLEESVERSREESVERSVMDEASGEALRMLHRRIGDLEREKVEGERRENEVRQALMTKEMELRKMAEELTSRDRSERELQAGIKAAKEQMEQMGQQVQTDERQVEERGRLQSIDPSAWEQDRARLVAINDRMREEQVGLQSQITGLREDVVRKEDELAILKSELEAQWKHTEQAGEEIERLKQDKVMLSKEMETLRDQLSSLEAEHDESEAKKIELDNEVEGIWAEREELEKENHNLEDQLRGEMEHTAELTRALQEREDHVSTLERERQFAYDSVTRLQENIRQRDSEISELSKRFRDREAQAEDIHESLARQKREHARIVDEQSRKLSEVVAREVESRHNMERAVREKAEADVIMNTLQERVNSMTEELEKLRRQVYELQHESAEKEIKLAQVSKQRAQDKEDLQGLNIALDSKQQELELLKRRMGTRTSIGTAQSTVTRVPFRRESSIFGTPNVSRPPSALSDAASTASKERKLSDPPAAKPLARSMRPNGPAAKTTRRMLDNNNMGPPSAVKRPSLASAPQATPTRIPSSFGRSSSVTPAARPARSRASSSLESLRQKGGNGRDSVLSASDVSEQSEKENVSVTPAASRRMSIAMPA